VNRQPAVHPLSRFKFQAIIIHIFHLFQAEAETAICATVTAKKIAAQPRHQSRAKHIPKIILINRSSYLLDVVVAQGTAILKLLSGEDQALLVRGDTLLVLDLGLDVVDGVARLDVEGNGLTRQGLDETMIRYLSATYPDSIHKFIGVDDSILGCVAALRDRDGGRIQR
jgi:hypothetical protein